MSLGTLLPFQSEAAARITVERRLILNFPTGAGKTLSAINAVKNMRCKKILVVCPAMVRRHWERELDRWWPEHPDVGIIRWGRNRTLPKKWQPERDRTYQASIQIVSWALLDQVEDKFDVIILDECHYLKSPSSKQFKVAMSLMQRHPWPTPVIGLSATIMPDTPLDIWGPVHLLWPNRFGQMKKFEVPWNFKFRYMNMVHNGYGYSAKGTNPAYRRELSERLKHMVYHVDRSEIDHLLPPCRMVPMFIDPVEVKDFKSLKDDFKSEGKSLHLDKVSRLLHRAAHLKMPHILSWFDSNQDISHSCIVVYHKDIQQEIVTQLRKQTEYEVHMVSGDDPVDQRHKVIDAARNARKSVLVATMSSINIGIDLTYVHRVLIAELYYRPETMVQLFGRFNRLSSKHSVLINIMILERTLDEIIATKLQQKIEDIQSTSNPDAGFQRTAEALEKTQTEEEEKIAFESMLASYTGDLY
jgi:SWI/SNF-related matrix-associated actin-dependent regulator 1 of chromatin subfamily A